MVFGYKFIVNVWFLSLERIYTVITDIFAPIVIMIFHVAFHVTLRFELFVTEGTLKSTNIGMKGLEMLP